MIKKINNIILNTVIYNKQIENNNNIMSFLAQIIIMIAKKILMKKIKKTLKINLNF